MMKTLNSLFVISKRFCSKKKKPHVPMKHKDKRTRKLTLPKSHPRVQSYMAIRIRDEAKKKEPIQPFREEPDRPRMDNDPDPFNIKLKPETIHPQYYFKEYPLHPGIKPDQLRYNFNDNDILMCQKDYDMLNNKHLTDESLEDFHLIKRALSYHNGSEKEINHQLKLNERERWSFHEIDWGNTEIAIIYKTFRLRQLKKAYDTGKYRNNETMNIFNRIYQKRKKNMRYLREKDFGRYKKVMTYLGLRDKFNPSIMRGTFGGIHNYAWMYSRRKPPGGRLGMIK